MTDIASPIQNFNQLGYGLRDLADLIKREVMLSMNCHALATVKSFDPAKQTITATINYKKTYMDVPVGTNPNQETVNYVPRNVDYPILIDCPVYILQGGGFALTFPIAVGDQCSILFNDRDIDNWFQAGAGAPVATPRLHSFSDGIALIGLNNLSSLIASYDTTHALLFKGSTKLGISATKILATNAAGKTLKDVMSDLLATVSSLNTAMNTFMTTLAALTPPSTPVTNAILQVPAAATVTSLATVTANIATALTEIQGLLE